MFPTIAPAVTPQMIVMKVVLAAIAAAVIPLNRSEQSNGATNSFHVGGMPGIALARGDTGDQGRGIRLRSL